jgi:hypothetical protein
MITNQLLYQLSYTGMRGMVPMRPQSMILANARICVQVDDRLSHLNTGLCEQRFDFFSR